MVQEPSMNGGGGGGDSELKEILVEMVEALKELLEDEEVKNAIPARFWPFIKLAVKVLEIVVKLV